MTTHEPAHGELGAQGFSVCLLAICALVSHQWGSQKITWEGHGIEKCPLP